MLKKLYIFIFFTASHCINTWADVPHLVAPTTLTSELVASKNNGIPTVTLQSGTHGIKFLSNIPVPPASSANRALIKKTQRCELWALHSIFRTSYPARFEKEQYYGLYEIKYSYQIDRHVVDIFAFNFEHLPWFALIRCTIGSPFNDDISVNEIETEFGHGFVFVYRD